MVDLINSEYDDGFVQVEKDGDPLGRIIYRAIEDMEEPTQEKALAYLLDLERDLRRAIVAVA